MKCSVCGASIAKDSLFCSHCGAPVEQQQKEKIKEDKLLDASPYVHDSDRKALKALRALPGFTPVLKAFTKIWSERQFQIQNMSSCVRINEKQLKEYHEMLLPICEKLRIDVPEFYLSLNPEANSYTFGDTSPFIVITSGLLETLPHDLIPTVLAHECGHIDCHHSLYTTMGSLILNGASVSLDFLGLGSLISLPLKVAFYYWMRCSEFSADRAAVLCDGGYEKMAEVCMRLAGYDKDIQFAPSLEVFMEQANDYKEMVDSAKWNKTLELLAVSFASHPLLSVRAREVSEWVKTDQYQSLLSVPW